MTQTVDSASLHYRILAGCAAKADKCVITMQDELMPKYAELLYNGFWYSPERLALQAAIDKTQEFVTGTVRLKLYKVMWCSPADISHAFATL
jgi:argininosuccinate synthase